MGPRSAHVEEFHVHTKFAGSLAVAVLLAGVTAGCSGSSSDASPTASPSASSAPVDATSDVALDTATRSASGTTVPVRVTNHSSKRSDYDVVLALVSQDGKTRYDSTFDHVLYVEPGQTALDTASFTRATGTYPANAVVKVIVAKRTPSA